MATPQQRERRPAEVQVPQLSREETERRAGRAFDSALVGLLQQYFRGPPPAAELAAFRRMVNEALSHTSPGQIIDISPVLRSYVDANPDSVMARYYRFTNGSSDWIINERGQVAFSQSTLTRDVTDFFGGARSATVSTLATLSDPNNRSAPLNISPFDLVLSTRRIPPAREGEEEQVIETRAGAILHAGISAQISRGQNQLPATSTWQQPSSTIMLASTLPPPETRYGPGEFQKPRKG